MHWKKEHGFSFLFHAIVATVEDTEDSKALAFIPKKTIKYNIKRFTKIADESDVELRDLMFDIVYLLKRYGLLPECEFMMLNSVIIHCDKNKNGMTCSEVLELVMQLLQTADLKKAANHYNYLVHIKWLKGLKHGGQVSTAQKTSTKHCQIMVEQQLH